MTISYIKIFNQILDDLLVELIEIFPEETKLKVEYTLFQVMCSANAKKISNEFMNNCIPHLNKIYIKDEQFFMGDSKPNFLNKICINKLWIQLSITNKETIWKYIRNILSIGVHIIQVSEEDLITIQLIINS